MFRKVSQQIISILTKCSYEIFVEGMMSVFFVAKIISDPYHNLSYMRCGHELFSKKFQNSRILGRTTWLFNFFRMCWALEYKSKCEEILWCSKSLGLVFVFIDQGVRCLSGLRWGHTFLLGDLKLLWPRVGFCAISTYWKATWTSSWWNQRLMIFDKIEIVMFSGYLGRMVYHGLFVRY